MFHRILKLYSNCLILFYADFTVVQLSQSGDTSWREWCVSISRNHVHDEASCRQSGCSLSLHFSAFPFVGLPLKLQLSVDIFLVLHMTFVGSSSPLASPNYLIPSIQDNVRNNLSTTMNSSFTLMFNLKVFESIQLMTVVSMRVTGGKHARERFVSHP